MSTAPVTQDTGDVNGRPVAWAVFADNGNIRIWSHVIEPVRELVEKENLKLVPLYAIPAGWRLVPEKPTAEMLGATSWPGCAATDWRHMLAAAPALPSV